MAKYLLIDFGASRIKSAVADLRTGVISKALSQPALAPRKSADGIFEVPAAGLGRSFANICSRYAGRRGENIEGIVICSEMHGFAVIGASAKPKTGYISWKDSRGMSRYKGVSSFDLVSSGLGSRFRSITGMTLRAGLPYLNALHLARTGVLKNGDRIVSLPALLAAVAGRGNLSSHETMAAGLGFYDIYRRESSAELADFFRAESGISPVVPGPAATPVCGYVRCGGREVPVFAGIGDHQCAVLGAGNGPDTISVNIGTGSQVSVLSRRKEPAKNQQRPFFDGFFLNTITHIPAGRALNEYVFFLQKTAASFGCPKTDVWKALSSIKVKEAAAASLKFDLGIFPGAWGFSGGGAISGITEGHLTPENYLASLLKSVAAQYSDAVGQLAPAPGKKILMSGGISHKLGVLRPLIAGGAGIPAVVAAESEETFAGLRAAAAVFSGREKSFVKSAESFS